jgi:hypothetical protein
MCVWTIVCEYWPVFAILLVACKATGAGAARIYHATHGGQCTLFEFLHLAPHLHHAPDDFVAWHARINSIVPLVANLM